MQLSQQELQKKPKIIDKFSLLCYNVGESCRRAKTKRIIVMNEIDQLAQKLAKELLKDHRLLEKTFVFVEDKYDVLSELQEECENVLEQWEDKYNSLSERMQESSRGQKIDEVRAMLSDFCDALSQAVNELEYLKDHL